MASQGPPELPPLIWDETFDITPTPDSPYRAVEIELFDKLLADTYVPRGVYMGTPSSATNALAKMFEEALERKIRGVY
jgi:hypothetical protein